MIIDLNDPKQRRMVFLFSIGTILFLFFSAFGSYKAYEFSDSDEFCGEMCHEVMAPEYTAYLSSPHSRVGCVTCHIGSGAAWFVRAKISGAYQVYSVLFNKYSKPIPTPVENLRPAEGTCILISFPHRLLYPAVLSDHRENQAGQMRASPALEPIPSDRPDLD